jgi:hypothetical protein
MSAVSDLLDLVLAEGAAFGGAYRHDSGSVDFLGIYDAYPIVDSTVLLGDLRVVLRAADVPGILSFTGFDTVRAGTTSYSVVSIASSYSGLGATLQLRLMATVVAHASVPFSSSASGSAGDMTYDSDYFYVCVATNSWKRAALSTF